MTPRMVGTKTAYIVLLASKRVRGGQASGELRELLHPWYDIWIDAAPLDIPALTVRSSSSPVLLRMHLTKCDSGDLIDSLLTLSARFVVVLG